MPRMNARMPDVQVDAIPTPMDATTIPQELVTYFDTKGQRLAWGSKHDTHVNKAWPRGRFPVNLSTDVDSDEERARFKLILSRVGCRISPEGFIIRADCYLYTQSQAAHEADEAEAAERFARHSGSSEREAFAQMMNDKIATRHGPGLARVEIRDDRR
jgi:hypothetical protein